MGRRLSLPLTVASADDTGLPSLEAMRKRLGGRIAGEPSIATPWGKVHVGAPVEVSHDPPRVGVLIAIEGTVVDVFVAGGLVRRTDVSTIAPHGGPLPEDLAEIAESALIYARLREGHAVEVQQGEVILAGELVEKCRYGALVRLPDRRVLAVGFRKVWPARPAGLAN